MRSRNQRTVSPPNRFSKKRRDACARNAAELVDKRRRTVRWKTGSDSSSRCYESLQRRGIARGSRQLRPPGPPAPINGRISRRAVPRQSPRVEDTQHLELHRRGSGDLTGGAAHALGGCAAAAARPTSRRATAGAARAPVAAIVGRRDQIERDGGAGRLLVLDQGLARARRE